MRLIGEEWEMENNEYQTRKAKSLEMLRSGVEPVKDCFNEYLIPSQSEKGKRYKVAIKNGWYNCECLDDHIGNLCKHTLLLKTYLALEFKAQELKRNMSVATPCPNCEGRRLQKDGTRKTTMGKKQRWLCLDCKRRFVLSPVQKIKGNAEAVITAIDLYIKGVSYRGVADSTKQHDSNNNVIERFHESFRQRDKVMRGFNGNQKQYAENFRTYYNFIRKHQELKTTPAKRAGIQEADLWRELLEKATNQPNLNSRDSTAKE
ncbi:hypothetical protein HY640_02745 [Candidatus Woesearchaeota archaeon]|nr:hypothetical protein [Candidatus Woesearchaeota archaeon]